MEPPTTTRQKRPLHLWVLFALACFEVISAVPYGLALTIDPTGGWVNMPTTMLTGSPFADFRIPGLILLGVLGLGALLLAIALYRLPTWTWASRLNPWKGRHWALAASIAYGVAVVIWIGVEVAMIGFNSWLQPFHFCLGLLFGILPLAPNPGAMPRAEGRT